MTQGPAEGTPIPDLVPPTSIHGPALSTSTPSSPVKTTPAPPLRPAQPAPVPLPPPAPRPDRVTFDLGIKEALLYATMAQAPYPPRQPTDVQPGEYS